MLKDLPPLHRPVQIFRAIPRAEAPKSNQIGAGRYRRRWVELNESQSFYDFEKPGGPLTVEQLGPNSNLTGLLEVESMNARWQVSSQPLASRRYR